MDEVERNFSDLKQLIGCWKGKGNGGFPTIENFTYLEETTFTANDEEPLLHFEQRSWLLNTKDEIVKPLHWESGFFIPTESGFIDILNAQNSGRVEVLRGHGEWQNGVWILATKSLSITHDARMVESARRFELAGNVLRYEVHMATTKVAQSQIHLQAELKKVVS